MALEIIALALGVVVSIILPLVMLAVIVKKNKGQRKGIVALFVCGGLIYLTMQWGVKEHGLTWLFNNTDFIQFMQLHYIAYLFIVALVGAVLAILIKVFVIAVPCKRNVSYDKAIALALGYSMVESTLLVGMRSINTIIEIVKGSELKLNVSVAELFLSGYERLLLLVIELAIVVSLTYFIQRHKVIGGVLAAVFAHTMVAFLPGFFIAFSLPDYYEVFDRSTSLLMVYIVLTATSLAAIVILKVAKKVLWD